MLFHGKKLAMTNEVEVKSKKHHRKDNTWLKLQFMEKAELENQQLLWMESKYYLHWEFYGYPAFWFDGK